MKQLLGKNYIIKLIWIFIIGSIFGYFIEVGHYLIKHGVLINKQGLLYGPFKPIYGFAAVLITILLFRFMNTKKWKVFLYGCLIGGAFEYTCSVILEYVFKTSMWKYHSSILSINGRVYLPYLLVWGIVAVFWVIICLPLFNKIIDKINIKLLHTMTIILTLFLAFDFSISTMAVNRMHERNDGVPATTKYQKFMDKHYSDQYILKRIPYLKLVD